MKKLGLFILALGFGVIAQSQENPITNGTLTACGGFLVDSGLSAGDYSNNEDFTMTLCAEAPETILNLYFNFFDIGAGDTMTIYDGTDTGAPLIGTYANDDLQATNITSTNGDGCLTIHWQTDGADVGSFGAEISCGLPCVAPVVEVDFDGDIPLRVCVGDVITLDASPTVFAAGTSVDTFNWVFDDGAENSTDWPVVSHSFSDPGDFTIQLDVIDDTGCDNNNLIDVLVMVSTEPDFEGTTSDLDLCLGQEATLNGVVNHTTWTGIPDANFGGALFIPDDQSQCFESELTFGGFAPGATIESEDDFESFFINFEHSFMGDLTITFICPNGQSMAAHQQGGGGTFLGEPVDNDAAPNDPGVGYDYWWTPDATNGTWEQESGGTLASGEYSSVQPFSNLIGCPLNGTWTIEVCDLWGSDNGFIFDWAIEFDESFYPEIITFTPSSGPGCDSTFWAGPYITDDGGNCNDVTIVPEEAGVFDYTFTSVNNHGCDFSTNISVNVVEIIADAGPDMTWCGDDIFLDGSAQTAPPFQSIEYVWDPSGNLSDGGIPNPQVTVLDQTTTFTLTVFPTGAPECASEDDVDVIINIATELNIAGNDEESPCPGTPITLFIVPTGGYPDYDIDWETGDTEAEIVVTPDATTTYSVTITDQCGFQETNEFTVTVEQPGTVITADDAEVCLGGGSWIQNIEGGTGNYTFIFPLDSLDIELTGQVFGEEMGTFDVTIIDDCQAEGMVEVIVIPCEILIPNVFTPNADGWNNAFHIDGLGGYPGSILKVYNRWGNLVFESPSYNNTWSPSPEEASEGVYYYILDVNIFDGWERHSGHVTILTDK